jgi:hypothetical protein
MRGRPAVAVFLKVPRLGTVKSRLARGIGWAEATRLHRALSAALIRRLARDGRWRVTLWLTPRAGLRHRDVPRLGLPRFDQGAGDLGARMARAFVHGRGRPIVLVGTDVPELTAAVVAQAFRLLRSNDAVFGPATDGGYWLVGLRGRRPPFARVRWSTPHALADTRANLKGARVALLDPLDDIDTPADYRRWRSRSRQGGLCRTGAACTVPP